MLQPPSQHLDLEFGHCETDCGDLLLDILCFAFIAQRSHLACHRQVAQCVVRVHAVSSQVFEPASQDGRLSGV